MSGQPRFKLFLPAFVVLAAVLIVIVLFLTKSKPEEEEAELLALSVTVEPAVYDLIQWRSTFQGEVRAKTSIDLVSEVNGKITWLSPKFSEGGEFKAGEVLMKIEEADYRVALGSAKAGVAEASVNLEIETANSDIRKKQWQDYKGKVASAKPLQLNYPQVAQAKARLEAAEAQLASARLNLSRTKIKVPFKGRVMQKSVGLGQFVSQGSKLGHVFATDTVEIRVPMTDQQLSELQLTMGYQAESSDDNDKQADASVSTLFGNQKYTWPGRLMSVDASIDPQTRLVYATVVVDRPYQLSDQASIPLVPGFFVDVEIDANRKVPGLKVPRNALRRGNIVYVVNEDKLNIRNVTVLQTSAEIAVLEDGLEDSISKGSLVVTSPVPGAYEGMPIKVNDRAVAQSAGEQDSDS